MVRSLRALRERQREEYRDHMLAAAREIVAAEGAEALSMRRLADRLGCAPMSLYGYVRDSTTSSRRWRTRASTLWAASSRRRAMTNRWKRCVRCSCLTRGLASRSPTITACCS